MLAVVAMDIAGGGKGKKVSISLVVVG